MGFYLLTTRSDWKKLKMIKTCVCLLNLSIFNRPGEAIVRGREVGGEGVTYNALLREGRPRISDYIGGSSTRAKTISQRMRLTKKDLQNRDKK